MTRIDKAAAMALDAHKAMAAAHVRIARDVERAVATLGERPDPGSIAWDKALKMIMGAARELDPGKLARMAESGLLAEVRRYAAWLASIGALTAADRRLLCEHGIEEPGEQT